ncbi:MAG: polysaccharide deacetylase family protein [Polyangiaceae bacterium]
MIARFIGLVALGAILSLSTVACSSTSAEDDSTGEGDGDGTHDFGESALTATYTDGSGSYTFVDTHDQYGNTGVVDQAKFLYFHKVNGKRAVGLTQDCAWVEPENAYEILDVLKAENVHITFFISGPFIFNSPRKSLEGGLVEKNLPVIKRMIEEGHEFGSHTQNHPHNNQSIDWVKENTELQRGWDAVLHRIYPNQNIPANAQLRNYWRAPYGEYDNRSLGLAAKAGFPYHFGWNVDVKDATGFPSCAEKATDPKCLNPAKLTDTVLGFAEKNHWGLDGFVILSHLQNPYRWGSSPEGLQRLIRTAKQHDHVIAKISEMFTAP